MGDGLAKAHCCSGGLREPAQVASNPVAMDNHDDAGAFGTGGHQVVIQVDSSMSSRCSSRDTGTEGPEQTHIPLDRESGLTGYDISYANVTGLHTISKSSLRRRRGRLHPHDLTRLEEAVRLYLGL